MLTLDGDTDNIMQIYRAASHCVYWSRLLCWFVQGSSFLLSLFPLLGFSPRRSKIPSGGAGCFFPSRCFGNVGCLFICAGFLCRHSISQKERAIIASANNSPYSCQSLGALRCDLYHAVPDDIFQTASLVTNGDSQFWAGKICVSPLCWLWSASLLDFSSLREFVKGKTKWTHPNPNSPGSTCSSRMA